MEIQNAAQFPKLYYGLHMVEGVAEYRNPKTGEPYRLFIDLETTKKMNPSFTGMPVYIDHQDVVLETLNQDACGYVVRSFFNPLDGKNWVEFLVTSDKGHEAISKGWKLSNAYNVESSAGGGKWHAVEYQQHVLAGKYTHLAIVPNPRYAESIVLTPDEFKAYNEQKKNELKVLENSLKEKTNMKFNLFKKEKVENAADLETTFVTLEDGSEVTLASIVNAVEADMKKEKAKENAADMDATVNVGDEKMPVKDLVEKYQSMKKNSKKNAEDDEKKKKEDEEKKNKKNAEDEEKKAKDAKENAEKEAAEKAAKEEDEKKNSVFNAVMNAGPKAADPQAVIDTPMDQIARGKARYGSAKK